MMIKTAKDIKKLSPFDKYEGERRTEIKAFDRNHAYRGYEIKRNGYIPNGADGRWEVPSLKYIAPGGIVEGFLTVSLTQSKEAIDKWFMLNVELKNL
jgi:hypothetical protein